MIALIRKYIETLENRN